MPAAETDPILAPTKTAVKVALDPAHNALNSLMLIFFREKYAGLDTWPTQIAQTLSPELLHKHAVVMFGVHYAINPTQSWPSFEAYLEYMANVEPHVLRDRVLNSYANIPPIEEREKGDVSWLMCGTDTPPSQPISLPPNADAFLDFLRARFHESHVDVDIETDAYNLLRDPPKMQKVIVSHLEYMWTELLKPEWKRVRPMLLESVEAFQKIDLGTRNPLDAARLVTGQEPHEQWPLMMDYADEVIFVPSAHVGPYFNKLSNNKTLWLFFGARLPEGVQARSPDLSRSELLVRLQAITDDTRLRILQLIAAKGEQCSQDIRNQLDLSQSSASRHLQQLSATRYLIERRRDGSKCYSLNDERIEDTLQAISTFLKN